jgi:hypothetical protein
MITSINGHTAVLNSVLTATDENIIEMQDGQTNYSYFAKLDFTLDGSMEVSVKVGEDILKLPIVKLTFEVISNKDHQWMISKPEAEFLID